MADLGKQFLDTDGLNALWTKQKKVQPFYQELGTSGTNGWVNFLTVKGTTYMNHPLVVRLLCRGYSDSTMDVQFVSANNTTPTIHYFKQRIQPYSGTQAIAKPGYTYEDVDGVRYYKFWLKKNEGYGAIGVHVESEYFYTNGAEDTGLLTFPNVQSDTEPSGIVYVANSDIVYESVPAKTAVSAAAVKVGTNVVGQVVLGDALAPSDLGISATTTSVTVGSTTANIPQATSTSPKMDGTAAVGTETKWAKGDHVHPTDTSRAPTSHASSATTYGIGTTANYGHVKLATGDMNGATHADGVAVSKNHTHSQYVPTTRTVNGHALSSDVTVTAADVSAVRYDTASQGLTDTQKSNARTNIGAGTSNLTIGTTSTTAAAGNHTHTTSIASDSSSGTVVTLAHNTQYKLTAGGTSVLFKTPADNNTDTKVTQTKDDSGTTAFPLLMAGAADPNGTATTARYDSAVTLTPSTNTIAANISGNAATATSAGKLTTARELAVSLSNTSTTTTFDGSANVTNIKVSGTLPVANGGTGSTTAAGARTNLSVYSKSEVDSLMSGRIEVVTELPATGQSGIIYYVGPTGSGSDKYDEYIWTGSAFIKVGEHSLDLSNYVNTVTTSGSGSVVTGVSKSGSTVTVTKGNISLDDLSDWATETDVTISNVTYHTMWPVAPTSSNQVYGISINNGRLFRIYNNKGTYSAQAYDKDSDTTYTPQKLGIGYGTCTTAEATAAKVVTLTDYVLVKNGIVAVKFSYPLCASATLNINGKGAKPVYVGGAAVTATNCKSVQGGDIGYFIYDGTAYHFLGTDRAGKSSITGLSVSGKTVTYTRADGETGTFDTQDTTYAFADSYNASTNKAATVSTVTNAINALDVSDISGFGAGKTLATLTETNGKIGATFQDISITKSQVSDFSHTHGNIQNGGTLQTNDITIASGDKLVVTDSSDSSKVARASISFDGSTATKALTQKGTWETFNNYSHPAGSAPSKTGVPTGNASPGFGGTFKVNQITTDSTSHVSAVTERTITIPNATATTSAAGLMSAADKTKLDNAITKKTGFAYRGTSGGPVFKIAEKTFTTKTTTHSEQLVFDVSYSTHPNAIATSRLVVSFRVDANTSATMGFITNTVIRKQGFVELPYKFYGAVDYANGKFTLYAKYISGSYVTVEAECILASSENTDIIDNVSVFKTTTAELPDTSKEETTIWVASADRAYGTDGYISYSAAKCDIFAERTPMGSWSLNNRNGVRIQLYTYTAGNESGATLVWDSDTATGDIKEKFLNAQETGTLLTTTAGQCIKVVYTGTTNSYFRALGVFMSVKVADNSHTASGHLRMSGTDYPSYNIDTYGSLVTAINSTNDFLQSATLLVEPNQPEGRIRVFGFRCLNTYTGGGTLIGTADTARAYDSSFTGTNSIKSALDGKVDKSGDTMTGQLVNTLADGNSAFVTSHGTANKKSAVGATRTDTGVSVFMGVGSGGTNHGVYSETNANWIIRADTAGNVVINDGKATSTVTIGNSDIGSTTKPVYIDDGVIKAGSTYAGGTAVTLNNSSKAASTASFYAPTSAGTNRRFLRSNGSGEPSWTIPACDYAFSGAAWSDSGNTKIMWAFRLKGITAQNYNNILLSFDTYFWNNQKSSSDLIYIGWSNNGTQGFVATAGRVRVCGRDNVSNSNYLKYYYVKNNADTAAGCTLDIYIAPSQVGNSYGAFYVNVLNSSNRDLDDIIEKKETYNVALPEGAVEITYTGNIGTATKATQDSDGNAINATYFKSSGNVTLVSGTATKIGTQNGTDVKLTLPTIPAAANNGALQLQLNGGTATSKFTANQSGNSTLAFSTGSTAGTFKVDTTEIAIAGFTKVEASSTNGNIKINGTETTVYTHPTTAGNKHIPSGGSSGQFLGYDSAGTAKWVNNPNTDTKQNITLATTTKAFITGVSTTPTSTAQALTGLADTGVYLTTNAGELNATQYKVNEHCTMKYNSTKSSLDFTFS